MFFRLDSATVLGMVAEMIKRRKKGSGRPNAEKPKATVIGFRIDDEVRAAIEKRRDAIGILTFSLSDTVREILMRDLRREKLL